MRLVTEIYTITAEWPKSELFGLTAQVRRAAVSIPSNIAEGVGRGSPREAVRYSKIAPGSVYELHTLTQIAGELTLMNAEQRHECAKSLDSLARRISSFAT